MSEYKCPLPHCKWTSASLYKGDKEDYKYNLLWNHLQRDHSPKDRNDFIIKVGKKNG